MGVLVHGSLYRDPIFGSILGAADFGKIPFAGHIMAMRCSYEHWTLKYDVCCLNYYAFYSRSLTLPHVSSGTPTWSTQVTPYSLFPPNPSGQSQPFVRFLMCGMSCLPSLLLSSFFGPSHLRKQEPSRCWWHVVLLGVQVLHHLSPEERRGEERR